MDRSPSPQHVAARNTRCGFWCILPGGVTVRQEDVRVLLRKRILTLRYFFDEMDRIVRDNNMCSGSSIHRQLGRRSDDAKQRQRILGKSD